MAASARRAARAAVRAANGRRLLARAGDRAAQQTAGRFTAQLHHQQGPPLADAIGGGLTLLVSLALIGLNADQPATSLAPFFLAGASGTALLLYSAAIGDTRVDACREWKAKAPAVMTRPPREPARIAPRPAPVAPPTVAPLPPDPLVPQRADPE